MRLHRACDAGESHESGAAVVEFALVIPVLLVVLLGILDFGKAFNYWIDETQLASAGARWAVVNLPPGQCIDGSTATSLQNYIQCQASTNELRLGGTSTIKNKAQVCISFPPVTGHTSPLIGDPVRVTVSVDYNWLPLISDAITKAATTISGSSTMRLEAPPTYTAGCST